MKQRLSYIDEISGLLIIVMVSIHVVSRCIPNDTILLRVFFFFMPWFYFKSGLLYRSSKGLLLVKKIVQKLLKPYISFMIIGIVIELVITKEIGQLAGLLKSLLFTGTCMANIPLWFLLSLSFVKIMGNLILIRVARINSHIWSGTLLVTIVVILVVFSYFLNIFHLMVPEWVAQNMLGLAFYLGGYYWMNNNKKSPIIGLSVILVLANYIFMPSFIHLKSNRLEFGDYFLWYLSSVAACILCLYLGNEKKFRIKILEVIGRYSMLILCSHWILLNIIDSTYIAQEDIMVKFFSYCLIIIISEWVLCQFQFKLFLDRLL